MLMLTEMVMITLEFMDSSGQYLGFYERGSCVCLHGYIYPL